MSDKSFGDHMSRGIVKNPLLSTAVTGLSIEDLTQNAVLLPVSRNQALLGGQEQSGTQNYTLEHSENPISNIPSGDASFAPIHPTPPPDHTHAQYVAQQNAKNIGTHDNTHATVSNAPPKSEDDFDVNEYFARLQGSRYVSAPINTYLKDDANANLEAKEENLEEINLNEPGLSILEEPQSITADIAQNFSQLPTVLPQVASAVFSSFSNMLSMKSKEHTPEKPLAQTEVRTYNAQESVDVPLMGVSETKEVLPPPREPPVCGPGNFRMASKKKVYAQIPGLSSGETVQMPTYAPPPTNQQFFTPTTQTNLNFLNIDNTNVEPQVSSDSNVFNTAQNIPDDRSNVCEAPKVEAVETYNPQEKNPQVPIIPPPPMFSSLAKRDSLTGVGKSVLPPSVARRIGANKPTINTQAPTFAAVSNIFVPPPILTDQDSQTMAATFPPNASQAYSTSAELSFSSQVPSSQMFPPPSSSVPSNVFGGNLPPPPTNVPHATSVPSSAFAVLPPQPTNASIQSSVNMPPPQTNASIQPPNAPAMGMPPFATGNLPPPPINTVMQSSISAPSSTAKPPFGPGVLPPPSNTSLQPTNSKSAASLGGNLPPPTLPTSNASSVPSSILSQPPTSTGNQQAPLSIFTPSTDAASARHESETNVPSTTQLFNPYSAYQTSGPVSQSSSASMASQSSNNLLILDPRYKDSSTAIDTPAPEPKIPEPPKATGNTNFRMTKKRPQYYSGPIEGIGSISNNVVPTIAPVASNNFQGALFTPETGYQGSMFIPEAVVNDANKPANPYQGAVITPEAVVEKSSIEAVTAHNTAMFAPEQSYTAPTSYAFDMNQKEAMTYTPFDINQAPEAYNPSYNTAFDMSRQVTDNYEPPKESGFGIIGSLKSKLGSIDINKIQNSVTTFFDPAYNNKPEAAKEYKAHHAAENQSGIEIFVPNAETHTQPYNYDAYSANFTYGQGSIPNPTDYYQQQVHNVYSPQSYYTQPVYGTQNFAQEGAQQSYNEAPNAAYETPTSSSFDVGSNVTITGYTSPCWLANAASNEENVTVVACDGNEKTESVDCENDGSHLILPPEREIEQVMQNLTIEDDSKQTVKGVVFANEDDKDTKADQQIVEEYATNSPAEDENDFSDRETYGGIPDRKRIIEYYDSFGKDDDEKEYNRIKTVEITSLFSTPLHDLSSQIASKSHEIYNEGSEVGDQASFDKDDEKIDEMTANISALALAVLDDEESPIKEKHLTSDLSICETCREVSKPGEKEADLTSQLIENITAPIQLSNPVEVPLTESVSNIPDNFDTINQCAEICLIADETIETLQVQSATELLDEEDVQIKRNYGWRSEAAFPPGQDLLDHDFNFKPNSNIIGFFGENNLFFDNLPNTVSDDTKADFGSPQDDSPLILQRQMSIPTAPPLEDSDDAKSDETGVLDVQSIEQDASKDFPVFEEYVIEPSETDDDKTDNIDKSEVKDTFTNRVDRFKKLESTEDLTKNTDFDYGSITIMPSYFDTGNYAAETHFRNSLPSPTVVEQSPELEAPIRVPPGFENQGKKPSENIEPKIPETYTQTSMTSTVTFTAVPTNTITTTVQALPTFTPETTEAKLPDFASVFGAKTVLAGGDMSIETGAKITKDSAPEQPKDDIIETKVEERKVESLPDPINFFGSATQENSEPETVNRLASYFASPPKADNTKSFFELSQGQDHYRQKDVKDGDGKTDQQKHFFELSQGQNHYKKEANIPHERYMDLMKDLTSYQNMEPNADQVVRTVNHFTVEYDYALNFNKGEPTAKMLKESDLGKSEAIKKEETLTDVDKSEEIISRCKYCRDLKAGPVLTVSDVIGSLGRAKYKQFMDSGSDKPKEEVDVMPRKDGERSINVKMEDASPEGDNSEGVATMSENRTTTEYEPVKHHWFYRVDWEGKSTWRGFSTSDSRALEAAFQSPDLNEGTLVPTDGGRYDVNVMGRLRIAVYWADKPTNVRRCSWFYKGTTDARYVPYTEPVAEKLEEEYRHGVTTGEWHRRLLLPSSEMVVMHGPAVMVHFLHGGGAEAFSAPNQSTMRPRVVRRGFDESEIEDMEPSNIDHLLLLCHGVGSACDMRFRSVEEVVDDFRSTSLQLLQSHYRNSYDAGIVGRVEVLPISWHAALHAGPRGVDRRLARVTLASIPRLRAFTNDTVLDVLLYTSPHYCQTILNTVCGELNRVYTLFKERNPGFKGGVSLGGHSLGSVILYDLLCHQDPPTPMAPPTARPEKAYLSGTADVSPSMKYPKLCFEPLSLYALGSPIAIFECIRGVEALGSDFFLPTCRNFFNIFHPYDPIAYRIEPLVNPQLQNVKPSLIPHHKGRKRMHLELKETMARVGADLKQKLMESIKNTWSSMWASPAPTDRQLEKVVEEEIEKEQMEEDSANKEDTMQAEVPAGEMLGKLNNGRRVDYVLQEAPFEMINEYLFAMSSHVCYWESEDTMLLILREIYDSLGVQADVTVPQQSMSVQRSAARSDEKLLHYSEIPSPSTSRNDS